MQLLENFLESRVTGLFLRVCLVIVLLFKASCSSEQNTIHGSWEPTSDKVRLAAKKITFEKDGTFYFNEVKGKWNFKDADTVTLTFGKNILPKDFDFNLENGLLSLSDQTGEIGAFSRMK
ncbi:MAG: hypothetical protein AAGA18_11085 [Verrucomicrobiota bacterium]